MPRSVLIFLLLLWMLPSAVLAEPRPLERPDLTPAGEAYRKAIFLRGLDREVVYFDPNAALPDLQERRVPDPPDRPEEHRSERTFSASTDLRPIPMTIAALILVGVLYLAIKNAGSVSVSFTRAPQEASSQRRTRIKANPQRQPLGLQAILAKRNRDEALVALCHAILSRVVAAQGVLLHKSWTARDTLRRVPKTHPDRSFLQDLVQRTERVQFGGRHIDESEFKQLVDQATPVWTRSA